MITIASSRRLIRQFMLVQLVVGVFIAGSLIANWASAKEPSCERRALANDVAGQYVVTCEGGQVTAPMGTARRSGRVVRRLVGGTTIYTHTVRVGTTTVTHMGYRVASR